MKKNGRPKSYTAPYYPHQVEATPELEYLEKMHKEKGYVIYHKLLEMASKTYMHVIPYESDYDIQTLRFYIGLEYELVDDCIKYLVHRDFIDKELFDEGKIWIPYLIRELSGLYHNRRHDPPQKLGKDIITTCRNPQLVSELDSEIDSEVVNKSNNNTKSDSKSLNEYKDVYKDLDVRASYNKLLLKNPSPDHKDITRWFDKDITEGWNLKQPDIIQSETGMFKSICIKCKKTDWLQNKAGYRDNCSICGGEIEPVYKDNDAKVA